MARSGVEPHGLSSRPREAWRFGAWLVVAAVSVSVLTACGGSTSCTAVAAQGGVDVTPDPGLITGVAPVTITACVDDICQHQTFTSRPFLLLVSPPMKSGTVAVSVTIKTRTRQVFSGSTTARTAKFQPNGPDCPPTVWSVNVSAHTGGVLTA